LKVETDREVLSRDKSSLFQVSDLRCFLRIRSIRRQT